MNIHGDLRKHKGYAGEQLVREMYEEQGYVCIAQNYTLRGGELDLVVKKPGITVFAEVKVVDGLEDVHGVVTPRKCQMLQRTIARYMQRCPTQGDIRVDLVFVSKGRIIAHLENIVLCS